MILTNCSFGYPVHKAPLYSLRKSRPLGDTFRQTIV